jgi:hypothetical protein
MTSDWRRFCRTKRYDVRDDVVVVSLHDGRSHKVRIVDEGDDWRFEAKVGHRGVHLSLAELRLITWRRNRTTDLVGFRLDARERVYGEARLARDGTDAEEFRLVLDTVALESDRFEMMLTGRDVE